MQRTDSATGRPIERFQIAGAGEGGTLSAWRQCPPDTSSPAPVVVYVCGATFASEQAVGFRFDGRSWADEMAAAGYEVWAFDFIGYGRSDRYPEMDGPPHGPPLGQAPAAAGQLERVIRFVKDQRGGAKVNLLAHSWGTMPAGRFAAEHPELVDRLVFFAPIVTRDGDAAPDAGDLPAWYSMSLEAQHQRFVGDVPADHEQVLCDQHFKRWAESYLASEPQRQTNSPGTIRTPTGPPLDMATAWGGALPYDPGMIHAPLCIIRGEWDSLCTDADAHRLWDSLTSAPIKRDIKLSRGTHLLHLEEERHALHHETITFLQSSDSSPSGGH
jgi:pimeloyl-ACP methyl ester carboxylesterase